MAPEARTNIFFRRRHRQSSQVAAVLNIANRIAALDQIDDVHGQRQPLSFE